VYFKSPELKNYTYLYVGIKAETRRLIIFYIRFFIVTAERFSKVISDRRKLKRSKTKR